MTEYSLIFPFFNEEKNIPHLLDNAIEFAIYTKKLCEFLFIDDNSVDNSSEVLIDCLRQRGLPTEEIKVVLHKNSENLGCHKSVNLGLEKATGRFLLWFPTDLQILPTYAVPLLHYMDEHKLIHTIRIVRHDPVYRKIIGKAWNFYSNKLLDVHVEDIDSVTFYGRKAYNNIISFTKLHGFVAENTAQNLEIFFIARRLRIRIEQVPITHSKRYSGRSKGVTLEEALTSFFDVFKIRFRYKIRR